MFFEISKFFNLLLSPISWVALLLIGAIVFRQKRRKKICLFICTSIFLIFTNTLLLSYVRYQMTKEYQTVTLPEGKTYKVAIVMGGFASIHKETGVMRYLFDRADRLWEAVRLWKLGVVDSILITGDHSSIIERNGITNAPLFFNYMEQMGVPREAFILEQHAANTRENALNTTAILRQRHIAPQECLLITSATHMERSLKCFAKEGYSVDFYPVSTYEKPYHITHRLFYPSWDVAIKWRELLNEWIGNQVYKMMGYI